MSTPNHAETDGQTERANRTIEEMLRAYVNAHHDDWDEHLTAVEFAYNDSVQTSTGFSPFYLNHGQHPNVPLAIASGLPTSCQPESASSFVQRLQKDIQLAKQALLKAQERQAHFANRGRRDHIFKVGDKVLLSADHLHPPEGAVKFKKLSKKAYGPFKIVKVVSPVAYELNLPKHYRMHPVVHISHLREFKEAADQFPERQQFYTPPPPDVIKGEEHFRVEAFVGRRGEGNKLRYLVRWAGYGADADQWLPVHTLQEDLDPDTFQRLVQALEERMCRTAKPSRALSRPKTAAQAKPSRSMPFDRVPASQVPPRRKFVPSQVPASPPVPSEHRRSPRLHRVPTR
jgi:hypothetical protein